MFQIIGSLLAMTTVVAILAAAPVWGLVFAFATLCWVIKARPARVATFEYDAPQGVVVFLGQYH